MRRVEVQCCTRGDDVVVVVVDVDVVEEGARRPFVRCALLNADGRMDARMVGSGGGIGLYVVVVVALERRKEDDGISREIIEPTYAIFVIQREESRGSRVRDALNQYPCTSSGHASRILSASSCWRGSSFTLRVLRTLERILL